MKYFNFYPYFQSNNCSLFEYMTIDEMFVGFRDLCASRTYIKSKMYEYGFKIIYLCCAKTYYIMNAFIFNKNIAKSEKTFCTFSKCFIFDSFYCNYKS